MRFVFSCLLTLIFATAQAFDAAAWFEKRTMLGQEADRLRVEYSFYAQKVESPAENLILPLEKFPNGAIKTLLKAKKAQIFLEKGYVWAEGVEVEEFEKDGRRRGFFSAESCLVDRSTKSGWISGHAHAVYDQTTLDGDSVYFSFSEEYVKLYDAVRIEQNDVKVKGVRL